MRNFMRLAQNAAVAPLLLALHRFEKSRGVWREDTYLRDYPQGPFGDVESVILRFPPRSVHETEDALKTHQANVDQHENVDQEPFKLLPEARPLVFGLMAAVQGERLGRVMINKLCPGGRIYRHADTPAHAAYWDRHHIVLQSAPGAAFICGAEQVYMAPGEIWWFDNSQEHEVINNSGDDRIHMIIDIRTSK